MTIYWNRWVLVINIQHLPARENSLVGGEITHCLTSFAGVSTIQGRTERTVFPYALKYNTSRIYPFATTCQMLKQCHCQKYSDDEKQERMWYQSWTSCSLSGLFELGLLCPTSRLQLPLKRIMAEQQDLRSFYRVFYPIWLGGLKSTPHAWSGRACTYNHVVSKVESSFSSGSLCGLFSVL